MKIKVYVTAEPDGAGGVCIRQWESYDEALDHDEEVIESGEGFAEQTVTPVVIKVNKDGTWKLA